MAYHYTHHHPNQHLTHPPPTTSSVVTRCCNCYCSGSSITQPHFPPPQSPLATPFTDPLLQAVASHLSQSNTNPTHLYSHFSKFQDPNVQLNHHGQERETHFLIASLLSRIESLEASLHRCPSCSNSRKSSYSLRDIAACIIQRHFRAFLVRRSRTLGELNDLAFIKSTFSSLKSSISNGTRLDYGALSRKTMHLLLQLDSIQGDDAMIRDGKSSITRDLVRFLDFINGVSAKSHELSGKPVNSSTRLSQKVNKTRVFGTKHGDLASDRIALENKRDRVEKISKFSEFLEKYEDDDGNASFLISRNNGGSLKNGILIKRQGTKPKVKKCVSFDENGNKLRVYGKKNCEIENASSDDQDEGEVVVVENANCVVEVMGSSEGAEDDEESLLENIGGFYGERYTSRDLIDEDQSEIRGQI